MELEDLFLNKIKALYDIESVLIDNLPKLSEAVSDTKLKTALDKHLEETRMHATRLEGIFKMLKEDPEKLESEAIRGLVKDAEWVVENVPEGDARDLNIIAAASYVEHYEMAGYQAALMWAEKMDKADIADILNTTFTEEESADGKLNDLAADIIERLSTSS